MDEGTRRLLVKAGFMDNILDVLDKTDYLHNEFEYFTGDSDTPYFRKKCAEKPRLAYYYATKTLKGKRFLEGEPAIARDPYVAIEYAKDILRGRFPEAESRIISNGYEYEYEAVLRYMNPPALQEFRAEKNKRR
jgi:hypothetical protein